MCSREDWQPSDERVLGRRWARVGAGTAAAAQYVMRAAKHM